MAIGSAEATPFDRKSAAARFAVDDNFASAVVSVDSTKVYLHSWVLLHRLDTAPSAD